ncbi:Uncharacterised protein [uncultured archaeon]|nr:Uncharacterised protein [uncultured archaeon]
MEWKKLVLAAIAFAIISQFVHIAGTLVDMNYYTNPAYFSLWSTLMMPGAAPPGLDFYAASILVSLITGLVFAYAFSMSKQLFVAKKAFKSDKYWKIGIRFGLFLFVMIGATNFLSSWLLFSFPLALQLSWLLQALVIYLAAGVAFAKVME